jgi:hypothetical protein
MQQSLRWNASTVQANSTWISFGINYRHPHAHIGSQKSCRVPTGSAAYNCNVQVRSFSHDSLQISVPYHSESRERSIFAALKKNAWFRRFAQNNHTVKMFYP